MADLSETTALLSALADPTRVRLMALLSEIELTVAELVRITGLAQSRVSSHLARLRQADLVRDRKDGVSTFYRVGDDLEGHAAATWKLLRASLNDDLLASDRAERDAVVAARAQASGWADRVAGRMEHHYSPGRTWEAFAHAFIGLLDLGDVLDVGSGDGVIARLLASRARSITCLDRSARLIEAARERLSGVANIKFAVGDMHDMPLDDARFDEVLLFNVLTYTDAPERVLSEAFRVLRPGGKLALITLQSHHHSDVAAAYEHLNGGFDPGQLQDLLEHIGFAPSLCEVTSRERKKPHFHVISAFAQRPTTTRSAAMRARTPARAS